MLCCKVRQWVLSLPFDLRYRLAYDSGLLRDVLHIFIQAVFSWQRRRARDYSGIRDAKCGAVTFVQRFGGAINGKMGIKLVAGSLHKIYQIVKTPILKKCGLFHLSTSSWLILALARWGWFMESCKNILQWCGGINHDVSYWIRKRYGIKLSMRPIRIVKYLYRFVKAKERVWSNWMLND